MKKVAYSAAMILLLAASTHARVIAAYDYTSTNGANPTSQGWDYYYNMPTTSTNTGAYDAGSGWRIVDRSLSYVGYKQILTAEEAAAMRDGWSVTWTFSLDSDAYNPKTGNLYLDNYFVTTASTNNQKSNGLRIEITAAEGQEFGFRYYLVATADAAGNLAINDGAKMHVLTSGGAYDTMYTVKIIYDGTKADMYYGNTKSILASTIYGGTEDKLFFGAYSTNEFGSVVYKEVTFTDVPEPATMVLLGLGGLLLRRRRA